MSWEYEGLFDAIPTEGEDLLSNYWRSEATEIRVGSMGYRTATVKAGTRLEAEIYPVFGKSMDRQARAAKQNMTRERQQQLNTKRAKRKLILIVENNFEYWTDYEITLTYSSEPASLERCKKDIRNFFNRLKRLREKRGLPELKYIYSIGHDVDKRTHVHCLVTGGVERETLEKLWGKGYANTYSLQDFGNGLQGIASYLYKQNEKARDNGDRVNYHMWSGSRNLKNPLDHEHKSDCKVSNRKVKLLSRSFGHNAKEIMEKVYPGYVLENCVMRFSDIVDGIYIQCVMRKAEDPCEKNRRLKRTGTVLPST